MNSCARFVAFWMVMVVGSTLAGEPKSKGPLPEKRPTTPREAHAVRLALAREKQQEMQAAQQQAIQRQMLLLLQQQALQQQALQQQASAQQYWQQQMLQQGQVVPQGQRTRFGSHAFPRNGAFVYEGNGRDFGGAMPSRGAYVYQRAGGSMPRNGAFVYQNRN